MPESSSHPLSLRPRQPAGLTAIHLRLAVTCGVLLLPIIGCAEQKPQPAAQMNPAPATQPVARVLPPAPAEPVVQTTRPVPAKPVAASQSLRRRGPMSRPAAMVLDHYGIEVLGVNLSAGGLMLDFRYRVTDPAKAAPLLEHKANAYLLDQKSGARMFVPSPPKVGSLRQASREPERGRTYFVLFVNPERFVQRGNKVTIVIGDTRIEELVVR